MKTYKKSVLLLISSFLLLGAPQAYAESFEEGLNHFVGELNRYVNSECPDSLKEQASELAANDISFSPQQVKDICNCSGKRILNMVVKSTTPVTQQQLSDTAEQSMAQCARRSMIESELKSCVDNKGARSYMKKEVGFDDRQYEQFCSCNTNLAYNESEMGMDMSDPQFEQVLKQKTAMKCIRPTMEANAAKKAKRAR